MADKKKKKGRLKKIVLLGGVGFIGVLALAFGGMYFASQGKLNEKFEQKVEPIEIPEGDNDAIARGKYLVDHVMGCSNGECHRSDMGGGAVMDAQPMGRIYAPNLTAGKGSVTKDFKPQDWVRILRHGLKKDGTRALIMPSEDVVKFSDADLGAVIAYIKSCKPVDRDSPGNALGPVSRMLVATGELKFAYDKIDHNAKPPQAEPGPTKEWGAVMIGTCTGCHGPTLSGGKVPGGDPSWPAARNLTPDATGLKDWKFEDFEKAVRTGKRPDGGTLSPAMPYKTYAGMTDDDVQALWKYLQTVPAKAEGNR